MTTQETMATRPGVERSRRNGAPPLSRAAGHATWAAMAAVVLATGCAQRSQETTHIQAADPSVAQANPRASRSAKRKALQLAATSLTDFERRVPHYFGPFPNWANSPFTYPDAQVTITGDGTGASATAEIGANGSIAAITVTKPGTGYTAATVTISSSNPAASGATATADINQDGFVTAITVDVAGGGYVAPTVTLQGGHVSAGGVDATATAYGSIDVLTLTDGGAGYTSPTVDFDFPAGGDGVPAVGHAILATDGSGAITSIVLDFPGSGYTMAPNVVIRNGTVYDPVQLTGTSPRPATATATLRIDAVQLDTFGTGYDTAPLVEFADAVGTGTGASATATVEWGGVVRIGVVTAGQGYVATGGVRKFVDGLPGLGPANANNLGQYVPVAQPDTATFPGDDYYVLALVQHRERMHSDLYDPSSASPGTLLREYVQLSTSGTGVPLYNDMPDGTRTAALMPDGSQAYGVDDPHYLGPAVFAQKDKAVRIVFYNLLPTGAGGDLFLPVDSTMMGSGEGLMTMPFDPTPTTGGAVTDAVRNPMCTGLMYDGTAATFMVQPKSQDCFKDDRATLHLHGGNTPWISDGTPHQWITPAKETTYWPQGVSVRSVPDMIGADKANGGVRPPNVPDCDNPADGCMSFYYTNQQSARLMFYHDHAWGITRLNVYAGEAAAYVIRDGTEESLIAGGVIPADEIPLVIQDRTFVAAAPQLDQQDPTWDAMRWGRQGDLWYHHVYMPAQNPGDPSGMSAFGRWMYGPWFWPPAGDAKYGPIANPYYDSKCNLDDPTTWQYQTDPFCEPPLIPGTPNISAGMEQFNDTPIVNGTAYPTVTLQPKPYRFRILNAANDRFWNLQWYVADPSGTEVALKPAEVAAAQLDPNVFPTPKTAPDPLIPGDTNYSPPGPSWIQIGSEGGFLPAPVVVPNQPITWIIDPTRFDVGNVDQHSLLLAPAERADVIVDFSQFVGKTLILYNDAPAAFPARVSTYDYYTGGPDLSPVGAPRILPGYGPNTRTIMQVKIDANGTAVAFDLKKLQAAFRHKADASGVFEAGQHPIIVGQAAYNSAYGSAFASAGFCDVPASTVKCDGFARISQQGGQPFTFDTLRGDKLSIPLQPKALHDEMNASSFDEYGRMQANLGLEAVPATPGAQNVILYQYTSPPTELVDTTHLPKATGVSVTPIATADDGTQIWKITHNGVDTHPIHFHAFDVQVLNRVTWDNIILAPDPTELGWKDTVRVSPLEDTIVALRPIVPVLPFDLPNSVRLLSPMLPDGATMASQTVAGRLGLTGTAFDTAGNPIDLYNHLVNFGSEYVWHCHILSHEEMDMMRPMVLAYPPKPPIRVAFGTTVQTSKTISWTDNSISETAFVVEKNVNGTWTAVRRFDRALSATNTVGQVFSYKDSKASTGQQYRIVAENTVGDTWNYGANSVGFPTLTTRSYSEIVTAP